MSRFTNSEGKLRNIDNAVHDFLFMVLTKYHVDRNRQPIDGITEEEIILRATVNGMVEEIGLQSRFALLDANLMAIEVLSGISIRRALTQLYKLLEAQAAQGHPKSDAVLTASKLVSTGSERVHALMILDNRVESFEDASKRILVAASGHNREKLVRSILDEAGLLPAEVIAVEPKPEATKPEAKTNAERKVWTERAQATLIQVAKGLSTKEAVVAAKKRTEGVRKAAQRLLRRAHTHPVDGGMSILVTFQALEAAELITAEEAEVIRKEVIEALSNDDNGDEGEGSEPEVETEVEIEDAPASEVETETKAKAAGNNGTNLNLAGLQAALNSSGVQPDEETVQA
ncbi:MAG: hypothetical protein Q8P30_02780 [Candidatus Uhrbacteria bacterium]|nr:hypothetical protein [Candidatus Uhrbacteria bacterium]